MVYHQALFRLWMGALITSCRWLSRDILEAQATQHMEHTHMTTLRTQPRLGFEHISVDLPATSEDYNATFCSLNSARWYTIFLVFYSLIQWTIW